MIYSVSSTELQRDLVIKTLEKGRMRRVIDVGGARNPWAYEATRKFVDEYVILDMIEPEVDCRWIRCDLSNQYTWEALMNEPTFDFLICTQTLEHVGSITQALELFSYISLSGFISVPNKKVELTKGVAYGDEGLTRCNMSGHFRGFHPHKWIFNVKGGTILFCFPKLPFIEHDNTIDDVMKTWDMKDVELSFFWTGHIPVVEITDKLLGGPDPEDAIKTFRLFISEGI